MTGQQRALSKVRPEGRKSGRGARCMGMRKWSTEQEGKRARADQCPLSMSIAVVIAAGGGSSSRSSSSSSRSGGGSSRIVVVVVVGVAM